MKCILKSIFNLNTFNLYLNAYPEHLHLNENCTFEWNATPSLVPNIKRYSYSALSNVLMLSYHQCTRTCTLLMKMYSAPSLMNRNTKSNALALG